MPVPVKAFKSYDDQLDILIARGMDVGDRDTAISQLRRLNYYRLSGYWYSFRRQAGNGVRADEFYPGTTLSDVVALYDFDSRLRTATFDALVPVELALRASLGHALGEVDECAHLHARSLSIRATGSDYDRWTKNYFDKLGRSKEEFVTHHHSRYGGTLPVWVAVEILDWGGLNYLYEFASDAVQYQVASEYGLTRPQLGSWLKSLNVIRNICAHHGRLFNRTLTLTPKLPRGGGIPALGQVGPVKHRTFAQLTLIQHMREAQGVATSRVLAAVVHSYPHNLAVPISHMGVWPQWEHSPLWS
ncbi:Abi family protein [Nocardia tengchongensis]|uniref:Abi family protein n=1 Tax=Nocardia tengchongensis TaxID=2055889 RepID=UPI00361442C0